MTAMPGAPAGFPELKSFRGPQLRATGSRVAIALLFRCDYRFLCHNAVVHVPIRTFTEGILYDAVFQRMKTDHHHAPTGLQNLWRRSQQRLQIVQFAVYEDSKSLKGPGRWMNPSFGLIHWP